MSSARDLKYRTWKRANGRDWHDRLHFKNDDMASNVLLNKVQLTKRWKFEKVYTIPLCLWPGPIWSHKKSSLYTVVVVRYILSHLKTHTRDIWFLGILLGNTSRIKWYLPTWPLLKRFLTLQKFTSQVSPCSYNNSAGFFLPRLLVITWSKKETLKEKRKKGWMSW